MLLIAFLWLIAPVAELAIIIVLLIKNERNQKKIKEMENALSGSRLMQPMPDIPSAQPAWTGAGAPKSRQAGAVIAPQEPGRPPVAAIVQEMQKPPVPRRNVMGMAALIVGIVFVVLAGLVFATTTWRILPDLCKVLLILLLALVFFIASYLAEKKLHIRKTGNGFYILGSIFLFFTVLAAGFFRFLGPAFLLEGANRYRVLWIGSVVTLGVWFAGLKRFYDRVFTQVCLCGLTVSMIFLMASLEMGFRECAGSMMVYAFLLLLLERFLAYGGFGRKGPEEAGGCAAEKERPEKAAWTQARQMLLEEAGVFVPVHFWLFSGLSMLNGAWEALFFLAGIKGAWEGGRSVFTLTALGACAAGMAMLRMTKKGSLYRWLAACSVECFLHYVILLWLFPGRTAYGLLAAETVSAACFLVVVRKRTPWCLFEEKAVCTCAACMDMLFFIGMTFEKNEAFAEQLAASAAVLLASLLLYEWSRQYKPLKNLIVILCFYLTVTAYHLCSLWFPASPAYDMFAAVYLCGVLLWGFWQNEKCWIPVLVISLLAMLRFPLAAVPLLLLAGAAAAGKKYGKAMPDMDIVGCILFLQTAERFYWYAYWDAAPKLWAPCLFFAVFLIVYGALYYRGRSWLLLFPALVMMPLPGILEAGYQISDGQLYGAVAVSLLITGSLARYFVPIVKRDGEEGKGWRIDYYHVLSVFVILTMAVWADAGWRFAYVLLLGLYCIQFGRVEGFRGYQVCRRISLTMWAGCLLLAFWIQPFVNWPDAAGLKVKLLLAAAFLRSMTWIWKKSLLLWNIQTGGYALCLAVLALEAVVTGRLADALILEGSCLAILLWAYRKACVRWIRISGILIVAAALYMTKGFWLSISWWAYLLAAGIGLILFAAFREGKKK